ncbi:putative transcriptional regulators [Rubrobacter radiotolerans]|uniref:GntR family transcriptional regulator n=1 Tax=Rubrobacter radiotolerans TaxID=42256 RepID=A0A023X5E3_RUBRA|nr:GntR family transcriptional regulator [Rubrobacter radiotolerans]AHY47538.1 putative transcriptional regulators [Rubrobacter radiotolerans]MDX5894941.1 GntR family transcriptional regulator [Rubrobacter radiotolerans]SMC07123.1 GntR family transcriptional regulator [Rubrobacter radiotolerans DSM 5868]
MSETSSRAASAPNGTKVPVRLSMDDPEPMYRQIESQLRDFILGGQLAPGTKLPSVRALAKDLSCSVITTRRAYQDLEGAGLIRTRQGMGTVVAEIEEGRRSAHRLEPVEAAFREALKAGRRAGFTGEELREVFDRMLKENHERGDKR